MCLNSNVFRFILTMWYVNKIIPFNKHLTFTCFILTMWYVNGIGGTTTVNGITGFILTMWYVNE